VAVPARASQPILATLAGCCAEEIAASSITAHRVIDAAAFFVTYIIRALHSNSGRGNLNPMAFVDAPDPHPKSKALGYRKILEVIIILCHALRLTTSRLIGSLDRPAPARSAEPSDFRFWIFDFRLRIIGSLDLP
jgi:hypothetical protein